MGIGHQYHDPIVSETVAKPTPPTAMDVVGLLESLKEFVALANFDADTLPKTTEEWDAMVAKAEAIITKVEGR